MIVTQLSYPLQPKIIPAFTAQTLAIGDFDGVHLGHQDVLGRAISIGAAKGIPAAAMTFHPHPREVLGHGDYTLFLTPMDDKLEQFRKLGLDAAYVFAFDRNFAALPPERFVEEVLIPLRVETVVVGFNFTFGHLGKGTPESLRSLANGRYSVEVAEPFVHGSERVSSTLIREKLASGRPEEVAALLGRPYRLHGTVVAGEGRGRTIGIPTANVAPSAPYLIPKRGVYAVQVEAKGELYGGVMNIGVKPTFHRDAGQTTLQIHLFDFEGDLYGQPLDVTFIRYIREETKFASVDALISQIQSDMAKAREVLLNRSEV